MFGVGQVNGVAVLRFMRSVGLIEETIVESVQVPRRNSPKSQIGRLANPGVNLLGNRQCQFAQVAFVKRRVAAAGPRIKLGASGGIDGPRRV